MKEFNVFTDLHGQYDEFLLLLDKMPKVDIICTGDVIDRGNKSKELLDFFMTNENATLIMGNHEHMMLHDIESTGKYDRGLWVLNGGDNTLLSFTDEVSRETFYHLKSKLSGYYGFHPPNLSKLYDAYSFVESKYLDYIKGLPMYLEFDDCILTHAPINPVFGLRQTEDFLWNCGSTRRRDKFQIHGHLTNRDVKTHVDTKGCYGVNLDTNKGNKVTAMHYPSMEIFEQEFRI